MGFQSSKKKNVWLAVGAASVALAVALSIALGVILTRDDDPHNHSISNNNTNSSSSSSDNNNNTISSTLLHCPTQEGSSPLFSATDLIHPEAFEIAISPAGTLCTLVRVYNPNNDGQRENTFLRPIGRSYSGHAWERVRGKFTTETSFVCHSINTNNNNTCTIDLTKIEAKEGGGTYQLTTFYDPLQYTAEDVMARFLEQATFGPTTAFIEELLDKDTQLDKNDNTKKQALKQSLVLAQWIQNQQNKSQTPIMSHRAIYRRHLNARMEETGPFGRVSLPCEKGSRFRRFTFSEKDVGKTLTMVTTATNGAQVWQVDGRTRTVLDVPPLHDSSGEKSNVPCTLDGDCSLRPCAIPSCPNTAAMCVDGFCQMQANFTNIVDKDKGTTVEQPLSSWPDGDYRICKVTFDKWDGSSIVQVQPLDSYNRTCVNLVVKASDGFHYSNPPIQIQKQVVNSDDDVILLNIPVASAQPIDMEYAALQSALKTDGINNPTDPEIILTTALTDDICAILSTGVKPEKAVIAEWNGNHYIFDPRYHLVENSLTAPAVDGGGGIVNEFGSKSVLLGNYNDNSSPLCANTPRTFVNENSCYLSSDPNVCSYRSIKAVSPELWNGEFMVTLDKLQAVYQETGAGEEGTVYLYAIDGLDINKDTAVVPPCQRVDNSYSRWILQDCLDPDAGGLGGATVAFFETFLKRMLNKNNNTEFLDVRVPPNKLGSCDSADEEKKGFEIRNTDKEGKCFLNVHPDHLNVYDFTYWVESHPGNSDTRNPIAEFAQAGEAKLKFPQWHEMDRWHQQKEGRLRPKRNLQLGTVFDFYKLPQYLRTDGVARGLGIAFENQTTEVADEPLGPTMVCGSPYEITNDPSLGGNVERGAFDVVTKDFKTTRRSWFSKQKGITWLIAAMTDPGQLRQRAAWALSQIFAISPTAIKTGKDTTENFLVYYDIFVRNAFGNYRSIMREVSFSPMMAEMLTYYGGRSTAVVMEDEGNIEYADENYAREIMQLFTIGLKFLNPDGTLAIDAQGATEQTYSNDDIEEYARAWTGFIRQRLRGNSEQFRKVNQIDPMQIFAAWRDRFPKMGLNRKYVGDGYVTCSDLPAQHFLAEGGTYQLLDSPAPELHADPIEWRSETPLTLDPTSQLYVKLSAEAPKLKIVLNETLACTGFECSINAIRTLRVGDNYYEYIRRPCVNKAFYSEAKTIARRDNGRIAMCADPFTESATAACCGHTETWSEEFFGERMFFATASERCAANLCGVDKQPTCIGNQCLGNNYYWASSDCTLKAKIDMVNGKVGIVHGPAGIADDSVAQIVRSNTKTFFRVDWEGDFRAVLVSCDSLTLCSLTEDAMCLCDVSVQDKQVFFGALAPGREDILNSLSIGAVDPDPSAFLQGDEVGVYHVSADGTLSADSVFAILDDAGQRVLRKNSISTVTVVEGLTFRNPVHFMSLTDAEPRDAHQETDATLDHYFYHPNTAPFLAYRFAQRFGISNPSPRYTEEIAKAFRTGTYTFEAGGTRLSFGSGEYGDLAATFAAVLLDREARDFVLDNDPGHGSLKEPLLKIVGMMRALDFETNGIFKWVEFGNDLGDKIGQMAHEIPSVFSFFLPEYQSPGPVSLGELVAPEAQALTGPKIVDTVNGMLAMLKTGLNQCQNGFGPNDGFGKYCRQATMGTKLGVGGTSFTPSSPDDVVAQLSTLLTAGRLSPESRNVVQKVFSDNSDEFSLIRAQMLISATPEFHATGLVRHGGRNRAEKPPTAFSEKPYKAFVYILLPGGYDSFNTLMPQTCGATNGAGKTLVEQYEFERTTIALTEEERSLRVIDASGQACEQFAVHPELEILERLYKDGDLIFFANAGQLDAPVQKENYFLNRRNPLFAHNTMQNEAQRIDPWDTSPGTGILGRMCDALKLKGFNPQPIAIENDAVATVGVPGVSTNPLIAALAGPTEFAKARKGDGIDVNDHVKSLTNSTQLHTSIFGETWSVNLQRAIDDATKMKQAIDQVELTQDYTGNEDNQKYVRTAKALANLILTNKYRGSDRDVLFATLGGWDMHADVKAGLATEFKNLNNALSLLESEMKAQELWDAVTVLAVSDFGRTLTANSGEGSDHAWGGHYFMFGGDVKGRQILGEYPPDISTDGPVNIGRGRILPTSSWESILTGPLQWMGLDTEEDLDYCMPNRQNTGTTMFTSDQTFKAARRSLRRSG